MTQFIDTFEESICILAADYQITYVNQHMLNVLGYGGQAIAPEDLEIQLQQKDKDTFAISSRQCNGIVITGTMLIYPTDMTYYGKIKWDAERCTEDKLLHTYLDQIKDAVFIKDETGRYVYANKTFANMLGTSKAAVIGKCDADFWDEERCRVFKSYDDYVRETKKDCLLKEETDDVHTNQYYETTKTYLDQDQGYIGVTIKDTTIYKLILNQFDKYKKTTTQQLEEVESKGYAPIKDLLDELSKYLKVKIMNIWLYNKEEAVLEPCFNCETIGALLDGKLRHPITAEQIQKSMNGAYEGVHLLHREHFNKEAFNAQFKDKDYYLIHYPIAYMNEFIGVLTLVYEGYPKNFVVKNHMMYNLSQEIALILKNKTLVEELSEELKRRTRVEAELQAILDRTTDIIIHTDRAGYHKRVNSGCTRVLGWTLEELTNKKWCAYSHPDDYELSNQMHHEWYELGYKKSCVNRMRCKDGTYKWLRWEGYYQYGPDDFIIFSKDITNEMKLRNQEEMAKKAEQLEQVRSEFFANLSHEFRTPLTIIMAATCMLGSLVVDEEIEEKQLKKYLGSIKQNSYRLLRLVNNLIDATKIDAGFYKMSKRNYNIIEVVEDIVMSVAEYAKDQSVQITFDTEMEEQFLACDLDMIERIMLNLLSNAIKYVPIDGTIDVMIEDKEDAVCISVIDNGVGIAEDKIRYIFERFMQVDAVFTRQCEGSGIGLSLVKSLVELHQGTIEVISKVGEGSCFVVTLPKVLGDEVCLMVGHTPQAQQSRIEKCCIEFSDIYNM